MNKYIALHKTTDKKITFSYETSFGLLSAIELSESRWIEEEINIVLRLANTVRTETAFLLKMETKNPEFDFMEMPKDLRFEVFWDNYAYKKGKVLGTQKAWSKLTDGEKIDAILFIPKFREQKRIDQTAMPYPSTYLNGKYWLAEKI